MEQLIESLISEGYLKTLGIIESFRKIDRADFVPESLKDEAYINAPLPIGFGQTISQPLTVAFMFELLQPEPGDKILDVGAGSGWTAALLAHIVSKNKNYESRIMNQEYLGGKVFVIERIPELYKLGESNVSKYNFIKKGIVKFYCQDGSRGLPKEAPFDKIIAAASAEKIPEVWKEQLKTGGRLVTPVGASIWLLIKKSEKEFIEEEYPGFAFVPLIKE